MDDKVCARCGRGFEFPAGLRDHLRSQTPCVRALEAPEAGPLVCRYCGRAFRSGAAVRRHVRNICIDAAPGGH